MKQLKFRRPSPAVVVVALALVAALAGTAVAANPDATTSALGKKKVTRIAKREGKKQATKQIEKLAPSLSVAHAEDATTATTAENATTAESAATAQRVVGHEPFFLKLRFGEVRTIATHGTVALRAACDRTGGDDRVRIVAATTRNGAILRSNLDNLLGPGSDSDPNFLNVATPVSDREFVSDQDTSGQTSAFFWTNGGYVVGPDSRMISIEEDDLLLAVNYLGANCVVAGVAEKLTG
jgi:hypothetical protein